MIRITQREWNEIDESYKGVWTERNIELAGDVPKSWEGNRTVLSGCISSTLGKLLTENVHFEIV